MTIRSLGIDWATARNAAEFLYVTIPANEMYMPIAQHASAVTLSPVNECMTPRIGPYRSN